MRLPKCPHCGLNVERDCISKRVKGKTYHIKCYEEMINEKYQQNIEQQADPLKELKEYICTLFNIEEITPLMENQLEKYGKDDKTPSGMLYTLQYYYELCENDLGKARGIGIIPYVYDEARQFYLNCLNLEKQTIKDEQLKPKNRVIKLAPKQDDETFIKKINIEDL